MADLIQVTRYPRGGTTHWVACLHLGVHVRRGRERARALRAEAEQGWADAKRWFEEQLLGPAS